MTVTSGLNPLKVVLRIGIAALTCSLLAPGIYGLLGLALGIVSPQVSADTIFGPAWLIASGLTVLAVLAIGVPAFLFLRSRNAATLLSAAFVGAVAGVLIFALLGSTLLGQFDLSTGTSLIATGALVGYLFGLLVGSSLRRGSSNSGAHVS